MKEKELLTRSGLYTAGILFLFSVFWFLFSIQSSFGYSGTGTTQDLKSGSRFNGDLLAQPFNGSVTIFFGTQSTSPLGTGTAGYIGTITAGLPKLKYSFVGGSSTITLDGFDHVAINGSDIPLSGSVSNKLDAVGGVGTGNTFNNVTIAGQGTTTATTNYSGANISPTEVSYLDGMSENISSKFAIVTGSVTNHTHTGSDGTVKISHTDLTPASKGTQTHTQIDDFIASKAQASGLPSLDANSRVVQNPASGTSTPGVSKIIMSLVTGFLDDSWLSSVITKLGADIQLGTETTGNTDNVSEGSTNQYYTASRVNAVIGSSSVGSRLNEQVVSVADGHHFVYDSASGKWKNATSTAAIGFSGIIGSATDNTNFSATPQTNQVKVPVSGNSGKLTWNWMEGISGTVTTSIGISTAATDLGSILLLHMNGANGTTTFRNDGSGTMTITAVADAQISTSASKFGGSSGIFDGTGDRVTVANNPVFEIPANTRWDLSVQVNPDVINGDDGIFTHRATGSELLLTLVASNLNYAIGTVSSSTAAPSVGVWTQIYVSFDGKIGRIFKGGVQAGTATLSDTVTWTQGGLDMHIGAYAGGANPYDGYLDEFRFRISPPLDANFHTSNFTPDTVAYGANSAYTENTLSWFDAANNIPVLKFITPGTATAEPSYTFFPGSVTVFGLGTNTAIKATATVYSGWFDGAVRATAFNVASTEKIKENIKPIKIKPDLLEAESMAKQNYIAGAKVAWMAANQARYTTIVSETGTGSVTVIDTSSMEADYNNYIELAWATDMNQNTYIKNVQKTYEKGFWQMFDSVTPRSWNPKDKPALIRKGFVVEDMPDVVRGDDGQSIDPMALIAYMSVVHKSMKADTVFALNTLKELITTGTVTQQKIDYVQDRLEVLNP